MIIPSLALVSALLVSVDSFATPGDGSEVVTGGPGCYNKDEETGLRGCVIPESVLPSASFILAGGLRYHTWSHDYVSHADASACQPCGGSGVSGGRLPELRLTRYTEPVSYTRNHLSFGVLSGLKTYEQSLRLERNKSHVTFDNFGEWNSKIPTDFNPGLQAWTTIWRIDQGIAAIHLFNVAGQPITTKAGRDTAHTAVVMRYDGTSSHFEIFWNGNGDGWGRLVALLDRHGNAIEIEYIDAHFDTLLDPISQPRDYFRKSIIRDAYGREAGFTYQLINNRHVVTRIDLPNGEHITYAYGNSSLGNPMIQTVTHADGSQSNWTVVNNTDTKLTEITIHDSKADAGHRRKKIYLTQNSSFAPGGGTMSTVSGRIRRAQNGAEEFVYDSRFTDNLADRFLIKEIQAADTAGGTRPETLYSYDAAGRLASTTDPVGRLTTFAYDAENRLIETTYPDETSEVVEYGEGLEGNLIVKRIDRNGIETTYAYDQADRVTETIAAANTGEPLITAHTYLTGTRLTETTLNNGSLTEYHYDHRNRLIDTTSHADSNTQLTRTTEYDELSRRRSSTDAYGRSTFYLYDHNDRLTRTVTETVPGGLANVPDIVPGSVQTAVPHSYQVTTADEEELNTIGTHATTFTCPRDLFLVNLTRDPAPNAPYTIQDTILDAIGQPLIRVDARGVLTWMEYDQRGRNTLTITAVGTDEEIRSETDYDLNSNPIEVRQPRFFAEAINTIERSTYTGRNLLATRTTAADSPEEATESFTYRLDGTTETHTDFRGNLTTHYWELCCQRLRATVDRDGASTRINNSDANGNPALRAECRMTNDGMTKEVRNPNDKRAAWRQA